MKPRTSRTRGALLLEALLALAVLIVSFIAILSILSDASGAARAARDRAAALDLARSAIAQIECGIARPETLEGPVPPWSEGEGDAGSADATDGPSDRLGLLWELAVEATPTEFDGLSLVTVTAEGRPVGEPDRIAASAKLSQLVRLDLSGEEGVGEEDRLAEEARRGAERERPRFPSESGGRGRRPRP